MTRGFAGVQRVAFVTIGALGAFVWGLAWASQHPGGWRVEVVRPPAEGSYVPQLRNDTVPQVMMVYLGAAGCAGSADARLPDELEALKHHMASEAERRGMGFLAVGVALDWRADLGVEHLKKMGAFDEVSAGYSWGNALALQYMWEFDLPPVTPQIAVFIRSLALTDESFAPPLPAYAVEELSLVGTAAGLEEILRWRESGTFRFERTTTESESRR